MMTNVYMTELLKQAAAAHHEYEQQSGKPDAEWEKWYADFMMNQMRNDFGFAPGNPLEM